MPKAYDEILSTEILNSIFRQPYLSIPTFLPPIPKGYKFANQVFFKWRNNDKVIL